MVAALAFLITCAIAACAAAEGEPPAVTRRNYTMQVVVDPASPDARANVTIEIRYDWAPIGAAHWDELIAARFYDEARFFRIVTRWIAQFGIAGDPDLDAQWRNKNILGKLPSHPP